MVRAIIFDLGGVLIDLDQAAFVRALSSCGICLSGDVIVGPPGSLIDQIERGLLSNEAFLAALAAMSTHPAVDPAAVDQACCALLTVMPAQRVHFLQRLGARYSLFLLSNTFDLHVRQINRDLRQYHGLDGLDSLFIKPYFSYEMGLRKPEQAIYQRVLQEQGLNPQHTLFVDDRIENIEAAAACGLQVLHTPADQEVIDLMKDY